jgi:hypothetical protein
VKKWVFALVIGLALIALSFKGKNDTITCGSETMTPGYVCEDGGTTRTYTEMVEAQRSADEAFQTWIRWVLLGVGGVLTIGGFAGVTKVRHARRTSSAPGTNVPHAQGAMPQPPYPAQPQQMWNPQQAPYAPQHPQQAPYAPQHPQQAPQPRYPQQLPQPPQNFGPTGPPR